MKFIAWFFDNFLAIFCFRNKEFSYEKYIEIPNDFEAKYCEVNSKLINFRTSILFESRDTLKLTEHELNIISLKRYVDSRDNDIESYAFSPILSYSFTNDDQLIMSESYPFFFLRFISLRQDMLVRFIVHKKEIIEQRKNRFGFGEYQNFIHPRNLDLIFKILSTSNSFNKNDDKNKFKNQYEPIVKKLKSVKIYNNSLILNC